MSDPKKQKATATTLATPNSKGVAGSIIAGVNAAHAKKYKAYDPDGRIAMRLGDTGLDVPTVGVIPTGNAIIDNILGRGGIPLSRLTLLAGQEGAGKTTFALKLCAEIQRMGGVAMYQDAEYKLDLEYAEALGVNVNEMILSQPPHMQACFEVQSTAMAMLNKAKAENDDNTPMIIVLDSVNSLPTKAEVDGNFEDRHVAQQANVISSSLRKLIATAARSRVALVYISQLREDMDSSAFLGKSYKTAGGKAPRFYASVILEMMPAGQVKIGADSEGKGGDHVGNKVRIYASKNQIARPFRKGVVNLIFGHGYDDEHALIEMGTKQGVIDVSGSWYSFDGVRSQGREKFGMKLGKSPEMATKIRAELGLPPLGRIAE